MPSPHISLQPAMAFAPSPAEAPARLPPPAARPDLPAGKPALMSVMCPTGFTAYGAGGALARPAALRPGHLPAALTLPLARTTP
jgi:hypothetical protein